MEEDLFSHKKRTTRNTRNNSAEKDNLFGWTIAIIVLIGIALGCWMASFYIFGHPERAFSYSVLQKLGKIDPPKRFELTKAPKGRFLTAKTLYERYGMLPEYELDNLNNELLRNYISNYTQTIEKLPYVIGTYTVLDSLELRQSDVFPSGVVALAQAQDFPQVLIEHLYTADSEAVPILERMLLTGLAMRLKRTVDLSTIIHIKRLKDGRMVFTLVPLIYGTYTVNNGASSFSLRPPRRLNLESSLPIIKTQDRKRADTRYADYRRQHGLPPISLATTNVTTGGPPVPSGPPVPVIPIPKGPTAVATPIPITASNRQTIPPRQKPSSAPVIALATPTPPPVAVAAQPILPPVSDVTPVGVPAHTQAVPPPVANPTQPRVPAAIPVPTTQQAVAATTPKPLRGVPVPPTSPAAQPIKRPTTTTSQVPLKPFLTSTGRTHAPAVKPTGSWQTYRPGQMPRAPLLNVKDAHKMANKGTGGQRLYLKGQFVVKASGPRKTVVRPQGSAGNTTRIIVEYPPGAAVPSEGTPVNRNNTRPFEIKRIEKSSDGQTNIYVREITR